MMFLGSRLVFADVFRFRDCAPSGFADIWASHKVTPGAKVIDNALVTLKPND